MAKSSTKLILTYVITLVVSFVFIGGGAYFLISYFTKSESDTVDAGNDQNQQLILADPTSPDYVPDESSNQTLLFILDSKKRSTGSCFVVVRALASEGKILVIPIQSDMLGTVDGTQNSLYEFYRTGGSTNAIKAIENALDITIDKYMKFDDESFTILADQIGGIVYNVPYNLVYDEPNSSDDTIIKEGITHLETSSLIKLITFPSYQNGETERNIVLGTTITSMVENCNSVSVEATLDNLFNLVINSDVETNITAYDYQDKKPAMKYIINPNRKQIAQLVLPSGYYDATGLYVFDESFKKTIPDWFKLN